VALRRGRWTLLVRCHEARKHPLGLEEAHRDLHITPEEFDEVAAELGRTLDHFGVPGREKDEVLAAFAAHKGEVTEGSMASA
jgi:hemoglobin